MPDRMDAARTKAARFALPPLLDESGELNQPYKKASEFLSRRAPAPSDTADTAEPPAPKAKPKPYYAPKVPHAGEAQMSPDEMQAVANAPARKHPSPR